jgi:DNA-directed RNA polymerase specialized sigma24 family protein
MRKKLWEARRKDSRVISGEEASEALAEVEAGREYDPTRSLEAREELEVLVPKVNQILSPKQGVVFFATAQELSPKEVAEAAQTTPGAARVLLSKAQKKLDAKLRPKKPERKRRPKKEVA